LASPAVCRSLPLQPPRPSLRRFPARASYYQWPGGQRTAARQDKTGCSAVFDNPFGTEPGFRCKRHNDLRVVCLEINFPTFGCIAGSPGALTFTRSSGPKAARSGRSVVEDWWLTVAPAVSWAGRPCRQPRTSGSPAPELDPYPADLPYRARLQMGTSAAYVPMKANRQSSETDVRGPLCIITPQHDRSPRRSLRTSRSHGRNAHGASGEAAILARFVALPRNPQHSQGRDRGSSSHGAAARAVGDCRHKSHLAGCR